MVERVNLSPDARSLPPMPYDANDELDELRTRTDWYTQLLATTRDAVVCIDRSSRIVLFNHAAEQMFGYAAADVLGQDVKILMAEPYASEHGAYVDRYEHTRVPIELAVTEVKLGETARYGAFIRDISEKIALQEKLLERERLAAIGTTAASFAHEIGNPLNSMYMHAQLLERRLARVEQELDPRIHDSVAALLGETRRLSHLLDEFRALARRHRLSVVPTDLTSLIHDVLGTETPSLNARGINVESELPEHLRTSFIDSEKIRQVLLNLIKNASDAMPEGGRLRLKVVETETRVRVEIHDNGCGMPKDIDPYEPFVTSKPDGTGLGLPVALQIVQAHGGTLRHEPAEGGGTVFSLELPRRDRFARPDRGVG
jgi:signal transduction histidine kinase